MRFEDLPPAARTEAARAVRAFMQKNDCVSLVEACQILNLPSLQALWDRIMAEAGLPACEAPAFTAFL
jgi:hypothetical protein